MKNGTENSNCADVCNVREEIMKSAGCLLLLISLGVSTASRAQNLPPSSSNPNPGPVPAAAAPADEGRNIGGYQMQQSVELGYRFTDVTGNPAMYDTLINQPQGLRLLDQSLSMRASSGTGLLFDNLSISSFGWGGDPENVARARASKFKLYDLNFLFRRNHNYFDYDLLANPLNPLTSTPANPVPYSPHSMYNVRRMYDFDLTLLPQSKFSIRLGMTHNRSNGPTLATIHEGTEALLNQAWNVTDNLFRFGLDAKVLPKTTISFDQYLDYGKNDTDYSLNPFAAYLLPNGTPVDLGLSWYTPSYPCTTPITNGGANPSCNGNFSYLRNQRVRTTTPTEQLRLVSNYFQRVNLVAQTTYSNTDLSSPYLEIFNGLISRNGVRQDAWSGPANVRRVDATADLGLTVEVTKSISISDSFRYDNWHLPGSWASVEMLTIGAGSPVTLLSPLGTTTTTDAFQATFFGMRTFRNLLQVQYNPSRRVGVHVGYKLDYRNVFKAEPETVSVPESPFEAFEGDNVTVNLQGPMFGAWWRPIDKLRINVEAEALTDIGCQACANAQEIFITRMSPKQQQTYKGRVEYKPTHWANVSGSLTWWEARNGEIDTQAAQHNRNAGATLSLFPNDRISVDLSYNFSDILQDAYVCFNGTYLPAGGIANACPTYDPTMASANPNPNWIYSTYVNNTHYFNGLVMFKPVKKLTANVGYGLTKTDGNITLLNPLAPLGPSQFTYHQPLASLSYQAVKDWSLNAYWNYDQYAEGSFVGPTLPRYFHDNRTVLSVKYAF
jgi:hypothetical protein